MRAYGALSPIDGIPIPPDTVQTLFMTGGSSAQALDWFVSSGAAPNAGNAGAQLVRFTGYSSAGAQLGFMVNMVSTHAAVPSSGSSVTSGTTQTSTGNNIPVLGEKMFQIPSYSTGYSVASFSSGYVMAEVWRK